jgi:release factor glutamine methyltransferase
MQLKQALTLAIERLEAADVGSSRMNAETLLMFVLGCNRAYLYTYPERELTDDEATRYEKVVALRAADMPSQYITGHQEFWGLDLVVSPAVLIPRPETEHLVETVLELAREVPNPKIVDVGTGSGCVALALANELKGAEVYGVDLSPAALEIAQANAARLQLGSRVRFLRGNVLQVAAVTGSAPWARALGSDDDSPEGFCRFRDFDFVVSNPPYVGLNEADKVQRSVFKFEPRMAVFAGENGLDVIQPLVTEAHDALRAGGWLAVEIGFSLRDAVLDLLSPTMWEAVQVVPDLQGIPRVIATRKNTIPRSDTRALQS